MQFINSEYCFFFYYYYIHCEAEYEHLTDNMFQIHIMTVMTLPLVGPLLDNKILILILTKISIKL